MESISEPHRLVVTCPRCGGNAAVHYVTRTDTGLQVIDFFCEALSGQTHGTPPHRVLVELVVDALWGPRPLR